MIPPTPDPRGFANAAERRTGGTPHRAIAVVIATIVCFAGLAVAVGVTVSLPPDILERKVAAAERHLYYRITHTTGPVFELEGNETSLRLIVHAVVPGDGYDPARELELGARVELLDDSHWRRDVHTRARQSKARPIVDRGESIWLDENTFSLHRGIQLTDDRQLVVPLPATFSPGTKVRVTLLGDVQEGIVRAYTPVPRTHIGRRVDAMRVVDRDHAAAQLGVEPWDQLSVSRELAALRFSEHRLSAEGEEGEDYEIKEVYTTGFRLREAAVVETGMLVAVDRASAVNVVGPTQLELVARRADMLDPAPATVTVTALGEGTPLAPQELLVAAGDAAAHRTIAVPQGVYTLSIVATRATRVELHANPAATLGAAPTSPIVPDVQRITTYVATNDGEPLRVAIAGPDDQLGRAVRIDVRPLAAKDVTLEVEAIGADKQVVTTLTQKLESEYSQYEIAQLANQQEQRVAEPATLRFIAPAGTRELRVRSDAPALVTFSTPVGNANADVLDLPYAGVMLTNTVWRYARFAERGWSTVRPSNQALLGNERVAVVLAQARLELREIVPPAETVGTSMPPVARLERQTMIERATSDDVADMLRNWSAGHYTRVVPGKQITLDFSRLPDRPSLAYFATKADADVIGETATLKIDGTQQDAIVFGSTGGSIDLPRGLSGNHVVEVATAAPVRLFVDRPPVGSGAELYAFRTVYRVPDGGEPVKIEVTKRGSGVENVNIVLYTPNALDNTSVRATIDHGAPARIEAVALQKWTLAERTVPLPPSDRPASIGFTDVARGGPLRPHLLALALGDDVRPGKHAVELRVTGARPIWGRFFVLDGGTTVARAVQWRDTAEASAGSEP